MIVLREYEKDDLKDINFILEKENIKNSNFDGIIYVVLDNNNLIGVAKVELEDNKHFLKFMVIKKEERSKGFGDALLRAILFKLDNSNINKLHFKGQDEYLSKKGFKKETEESLFIDIKDFFANSCNNCGESCGL